MRFKTIFSTIAACSLHLGCCNFTYSQTTQPTQSVEKKSLPYLNPTRQNDERTLWLTDDWGRSIKLTRSVVPRIVSLAPHASEILFEVGAGPYVVAVDRNSDYPALPLANLTKLNAYPVPDLEALIALRPTLVVLWGAGLNRSLLARIQAAGIAVFVSDPKSALQIARNMNQMEMLVRWIKNLPKPSEKMLPIAQKWMLQREQLVLTYSAKTPIRIFVEIWHQPLTSVSDQGLFGEIATTCGANNAMAKASAQAPQTDIEAVLKFEPQLWVNANSQTWPTRDQIVAQLNVPLLKLDESILQRPGPRWLLALENICKKVDQVRTSQVSIRATNQVRN
jgi:iron complex transport system substrate-binding protein